jgi:ketosteroid isomerase-like protein
VASRRFILGALAPTIAMLLTACGGGNDSSEKDEIANVTTATFRALETGDGEAACARLTPRGQQALLDDSRLPTSSASCEASVAALARDYSRFGPRTFTAADVSVTGTRAQAACEGGTAVLLRKSGDDWLVDVPACVN